MSPSELFVSNGSVPSMYAPAELIKARFISGKARRAGGNGAVAFSTKG
jgi:hypothetical protein